MVLFMSKFEYWLQYQSLDFQAEILKTPKGTTVYEIDADYAGEYSGPFKTLKEARDEGLSKVNNDLSAFRSMKQNILGEPTTWRQENEPV